MMNQSHSSKAFGKQPASSSPSPGRMNVHLRSSGLDNSPRSPAPMSEDTTVLGYINSVQVTNAINTHEAQIHKLTAGLDFLERHMLRQDKLLEELHQQVVQVASARVNPPATPDSGLRSQVSDLSALMLDIVTQVSKVDQHATESVDQVKRQLQLLATRVDRSGPTHGVDQVRGQVEHLATRLDSLNSMYLSKLAIIEELVQSSLFTGSDAMKTIENPLYRRSQSTVNSAEHPVVGMQPLASRNLPAANEPGGAKEPASINHAMHAEFQEMKAQMDSLKAAMAAQKQADDQQLKETGLKLQAAEEKVRVLQETVEKMSGNAAATVTGAFVSHASDLDGLMQQLDQRYLKQDQVSTLMSARDDLRSAYDKLQGAMGHAAAIEPATPTVSDASDKPFATNAPSVTVTAGDLIDLRTSVANVQSQVQLALYRCDGMVKREQLQTVTNTMMTLERQIKELRKAVTGSAGGTLSTFSSGHVDIDVGGLLQHGGNKVSIELNSASSMDRELIAKFEQRNSAGGAVGVLCTPPRTSRPAGGQSSLKPPISNQTSSGQLTMHDSADDRVEQLQEAVEKLQLQDDQRYQKYQDLVKKLEAAVEKLQPQVDNGLSDLRTSVSELQLMLFDLRAASLEDKPKPAVLTKSESRDARSASRASQKTLTSAARAAVAFGPAQATDLDDPQSDTHHNARGEPAAADDHTDTEVESEEEDADNDDGMAQLRGIRSQYQSFARPEVPLSLVRRSLSGDDDQLDDSESHADIKNEASEDADVGPTINRSSRRVDVKREPEVMTGVTGPVSAGLEQRVTDMEQHIADTIKTVTTGTVDVLARITQLEDRLAQISNTSGNTYVAGNAGVKDLILRVEYVEQEMEQLCAQISDHGVAISDVADLADKGAAAGSKDIVLRLEYMEQLLENIVAEMQDHKGTLCELSDVAARVTSNVALGTLTGAATPADSALPKSGTQDAGMRDLILRVEYVEQQMQDLSQGLDEVNMTLQDVGNAPAKSGMISDDASMTPRNPGMTDLVLRIEYVEQRLEQVEQGFVEQCTTIAELSDVAAKATEAGTVDLIGRVHTVEKVISDHGDTLDAHSHALQQLSEVADSVGDSGLADIAPRMKDLEEKMESQSVDIDKLKQIAEKAEGLGEVVQGLLSKQGGNVSTELKLSSENACVPAQKAEEDEDEEPSPPVIRVKCRRISPGPGQATPGSGNTTVAAPSTSSAAVSTTASGAASDLEGLANLDQIAGQFKAMLSFLPGQMGEIDKALNQLNQLGDLANVAVTSGLADSNNDESTLQKVHDTSSDRSPSEPTVVSGVAEDGGNKANNQPNGMGSALPKRGPGNASKAKEAGSKETAAAPALEGALAQQVVGDLATFGSLAGQFRELLNFLPSQMGQIDQALTQLDQLGSLADVAVSTGMNLGISQAARRGSESGVEKEDSIKAIVTADTETDRNTNTSARQSHEVTAGSQAGVVVDVDQVTLSDATQQLHVQSSSDDDSPRAPAAAVWADDAENHHRGSEGQVSNVQGEPDLQALAAGMPMVAGQFKQLLNMLPSQMTEIEKAFTQLNQLGDMAGVAAGAGLQATGQDADQKLGEGSQAPAGSDGNAAGDASSSNSVPLDDALKAFESQAQALKSSFNLFGGLF